MSYLSPGHVNFDQGALKIQGSELLLASTLRFQICVCLLLRLGSKVGIDMPSTDTLYPSLIVTLNRAVVFIEAAYEIAVITCTIMFKELM